MIPPEYTDIGLRPAHLDPEYPPTLPDPTFWRRTWWWFEQHQRYGACRIRRRDFMATIWLAEFGVPTENEPDPTGRRGL